MDTVSAVADPEVPFVEPCPECRFDPASMDPPGPDSPVAAELGAIGRKVQAPLTRGLPGEDLAALLGTRPDDGTWSPLQYACHLRDVLVLFEERTRAMVADDGVRFGWWDHEAAAEDYPGSDPAQVAAELSAAAGTYAATLASLTAPQWAATGSRRDGEDFTVHSLAVFALHEARHHLLDIGRGLRSARGR